MAATTTRQPYARLIGYLGGRKFIFAMATVASATYLVANKFIADGVYSAVVIATIGAYLAANVVQKQVQKESGVTLS